jgi:hypothetical protein
MWGIRAIRVGMFLSGLLVTIAGSGCCESCQSLWKGDTKPPVGVSEPTEQGAPTKSASEQEPTLGSWNRNPAAGFKDQKTLPTPDRIQGGIY